MDYLHFMKERRSKTPNEGKIEARVEVVGRRGRRRKQLLD
jgi:hypothetical protein